MYFDKFVMVARVSILFTMIFG